MYRINSKINTSAILLDDVIKKPSGSGTATEAVSSLNDIFTNIVEYAGFVVIAIGIISIILAMAESNSQSKAKGSMMIGGGIIMVSFSTVLSSLNLGTDATAESVTKSALSIIGSGMTFVGVLLTAFSVFQFILSFINMSSEEKTNASKGLAVGIAFLSGSGIMKGITKIMNEDSSSQAKNLSKYIVNGVVGTAATYIGVGLLIYGTFSLVMSFKDEDMGSKAQAGILIGAGVALCAIKGIFKSVLGI